MKKEGRKTMDQIIKYEQADVRNVEGWALLAPRGDNAEPRVRDFDIATRAGLADPHSIRRTIRDNRAELESHGLLMDFPTTDRKARKGRPGREFWLNEDQAYALLVLLRTPVARELRVALVKLFGLVRRGALVAGPDPETIALIDRQAAALTLALRRMADLEREFHRLSARAEDAAMLHTNRAEARAVRNLIAAAAAACSTPERKVTFKAMEGTIRVRRSDADGEGWNVPGYLSLRRSVVPIVREMLTRYIDGRSVFVPANGRRNAPIMPRLRRQPVTKSQMGLKLVGGSVGNG